MFWLAPFAKAGDTYNIDDVRLEKVVGEVGVEPKISANPRYNGWRGPDAHSQW